MLCKTFFLHSLLPTILPFDPCCIILKLGDLTISNWFWEPVVSLTEGSREWAYLAIFLNSSLWDENSSLAHAVLNERAISDLLAFWFSSLVCTCLTDISTACAPYRPVSSYLTLFYFYQSFLSNREMLCKKKFKSKFPWALWEESPWNFIFFFFHDVQCSGIHFFFLNLKEHSVD